MTGRMFKYLGASLAGFWLAGAWLAAPLVATAKEPPAAAGTPTEAPALLSAPAEGQASPLVPEESAPEPSEPEPAPLAASPPPQSQPVDEEDEVPVTRQGQWTQWADGRALWKCEFRDGKRHGKATRFFIAGEGPLFAEPVADEFKAPFEAQAVFAEGKLEGVCTIVDSRQRTLCQLSFMDNELEGESIWFYASGLKREVANHHAGRLEGKRLQYAGDGELVKEEDYLGGRLTTTETAYHETGRKQMSGSYFLAGPKVHARFDWLRGRWTATVLENYPGDVRTGRWTWWHDSGQRQLEGNYEEDRPSGTFTWWYPNGQKERQGNYTDGLQSGRWSWWFPTGQKQIEGFYVAGQLSGDWQFWREDGTRIQGDAAKLTARVPPQQPAPQVRIVRQPKAPQSKTR